MFEFEEGFGVTSQHYPIPFGESQGNNRLAIYSSANSGYPVGISTFIAQIAGPIRTFLRRKFGMSSLREEAEFLRIAVAMGLLEKVAAVDWADRTIMALDVPPIEVIEVSLAGNKPADEMIRLLASIPGPGNLTAAAHRVLGLLRERLELGDVTLDTAVEMFDAYQSLATIPEEEFSYVMNIWDSLYLAEAGYVGSRESVREELIAFLDRTAPR